MGLQVMEAAEKLSRFGFQRLVVSPFQRCLETAHQMSVQLVLPPSRWQVDTAVCEVRVQQQTTWLLPDSCSKYATPITLLIPFVSKHLM